MGETASIWKCTTCGLIFPNPMPLPAAGTSDLYDVDSDGYFHHHEEVMSGDAATRILGEAASLLGRKGRLLDVGAGRGDLMRAARDAGWESWGIEPSPAFRRSITEEPGLRLLTLPFEECELPVDSFDAIVMSGVLEHVYDPDAAIRRVRRLLRPGGVVFIHVPNEDGIYCRMGNAYQRLRGRDWVVNLAPTFPPFHVFGFSPRSLRALLSKHEFPIRKWTIYSGNSTLPDQPGLNGAIERLGSRVAFWLGRYGEWGGFLEAWAVRPST